MNWEGKCSREKKKRNVEDEKRKKNVVEKEKEDTTSRIANISISRGG